MHHLKLYLTLIRFDKPIGRILLVWPCLWGIANAYYAANAPLSACLSFGALLIAGAFLMSGFGCIINDLADRDFDRQVERTKTRPLAAGTLTLKQAIICAGILAALSLVVFWIIPPIAKLYATFGAVFLFIYPFMKRITYYPQVVLGLAFNTGVLVGYACLAGQPTASVWYLYTCGVFWTIAYDTIYAFQDIADDEKIGVKSTATRFRQHPKLMVGVCYMLGFIFLYLCKGRLGLSIILYAIFSVYALANWNPNDTNSAGKYFKAHVYGSIFGLV